MGATVELVDLECQSAKKRSTARPRFKNRTWGTLLVGSKPLAREGCLPGAFATLMAYEVMCSVTDSSKALTPFQTICAPIQTRRNDESFIITDIPV